MIVTVCPKTIILPTVAKPETVNIGKSDKIATSIVKVVWFLLESINMNMASPKGEVTTTCLKGSQISGRFVSENKPFHSEYPALEII